MYRTSSQIVFILSIAINTFNLTCFRNYETKLIIYVQS